MKTFAIYRTHDNVWNNIIPLNKPVFLGTVKAEYTHEAQDSASNLLGVASNLIVAEWTYRHRLVEVEKLAIGQEVPYII